ncbi:diacylglycerol kinase family protein [Candidatus Microgenomates bacterium]|nr:MAG: diacylglycerol kinase family protein [Candidatus Microgenomates bacterium]
MIDFQKLKFSFGFAFEGVVHALKFNQNLRIHFITAILVIIASVILHVNAFEKGILGIMILLVISAEMINTAIEEMVDFVINEHKREAKIAKDVSAGMVLLTAVGSVLVGILIFTPYIMKLFK